MIKIFFLPFKPFFIKIHLEKYFIQIFHLLEVPKPGLLVYSEIRYSNYYEKILFVSNCPIIYFLDSCNQVLSGPLKKTTYLNTCLIFYFSLETKIYKKIKNPNAYINVLKNIFF